MKKVFYIFVCLLIVQGCRKDTLVTTEFGDVLMNYRGEYVIEDWDLYMKFFNKAVNDQDRELLKRLCIRDIKYDEVLPDGSIRGYGYSSPADDIKKETIDRVDFERIKLLLNKNKYYFEHTYSDGEIIKSYTFSDADPIPERSFYLKFFYSSDNDSWWFYGLVYKYESEAD
jgi:hypothetical protein